MMMSAQEDIQLHLKPAETAPSDSNFNVLSVFLAGIVLGTVFGLVFASYLVKIGRIGGARKAAKAKGNGLPMSKDFSEVFKKDQGVSHRTSTQATTSDHDAKDEDNLL